MLHGLSRLLSTITRQGLDEGAVYRRRALYRRPASPRRRPGAFACPICGNSASRFLPFGLGGRPNAQCPSCGSLERHRFLWLFLHQRTAFFRRRLRVLHTAPEGCLEARFAARHGRGYVSVDRFNPAARVQADLTDLPFPDRSFDVVLSSHVLEHVADDRAAVREIARVLRPSGWAALLFPYAADRPTQEDPAIDTPAARLAAYGHPYHYRIYGNDTAERLAAEGLPAVTVDSHALLSPHRRRRHRVNRSVLFLARPSRPDSQAAHG